MSIHDGPEINPSVHFLFDLLKWVRQGRVRVPGFQRPYVWRRDQMLELFDSVRRFYPIGTLLFWRSGKYGRRASNQLGPFDLSGLTPSEAPLLLLDGQQRLTTLAGALLGGVPESGLVRTSASDVRDDPGRWKIYFDAATDRFTHFPDGARLEAWHVPVGTLVEARTLFERVGNLLKVQVLPNGCNHDALVDRLQEVARAFQTYKIPVVEFVTDDLRIAVDGFARVNQKGQSIGADEMFSALAWGRGEADDGATPNRYPVAAEIDATLHEVQRRGFGDVDRVLVLRSFLLELGEDPYRTDWQALADDTSKLNRLPEAMVRGREGLLRAIDFLREELSVHHARLLPYGLQLVGLGAWLAADHLPGPEARRLLQRWFWLTGASSWFGQGNPARYTQVLVELRDAARSVSCGNPVPTELRSISWRTRTEPFPERFDLRSARVRSLLCAQFQPGIVDLNGVHLSSEAVHMRFAEQGPAAMRTVWNRCQSPLGSSPANRMLDIWSDSRGQARDHLAALVGPHTTAILRSQQFDPADPVLVRLDPTQVIQNRQNRMRELEAAFLRKMDLLPPEGIGPSPVDTGDQAPPLE